MNFTSEWSYILCSTSHLVSSEFGQKVAIHSLIRKWVFLFEFTYILSSIYKWFRWVVIYSPISSVTTVGDMWTFPLLRWELTLSRHPFVSFMSTNLSQINILWLFNNVLSSFLISVILIPHHRSYIFSMWFRTQERWWPIRIQCLILSLW